jgi:fructose-1,6-bisphosphatase/inositol monophosphatase family enzyme
MSIEKRIHQKAIASLLVEAGKILLRARQMPSSFTVTQKPDGTLVTSADNEVQRVLVDCLAESHPTAAFLCEESSAGYGQDIWTQPEIWVIDPLDGTSEFVAGGDRFGIILVRVIAGRADAAWLYLPVTGCLVYGDLNSNPLIRNGICPKTVAAVRSTAQLIKYAMGEDRSGAAILRAAFPKAEIEMDPPSSCCDYVDLLMGRAHMSFYSDPKPWDHMAGLFLYEQYQGQVRFYRRREQSTVIIGMCAVAEDLGVAAHALDLQEVRGPNWSLTRSGIISTERRE